MPGSICARELAKRDDERGHENNYHQFQPFLCQVAPAELDTGDVPNSTIREGHSYQGDFLAAAITIGFLRHALHKTSAFPLYALREAQTASVTHPGRF